LKHVETGLDECVFGITECNSRNETCMVAYRQRSQTVRTDDQEKANVREKLDRMRRRSVALISPYRITRINRRQRRETEIGWPPAGHHWHALDRSSSQYSERQSRSKDNRSKMLMECAC